MSVPEQKKRLWRQFSLRSLLLLMLLVAAYFAGYAAAMRRARLAEFELEAERVKTQVAEQRADMSELTALAVEQRARLIEYEAKKNEAITKRLMEQAMLAAPAEGKTEVTPQPIEEAELP